MVCSIFPDCDAIARITIGIQSLQNLQDIGLKGGIAIGDICRCDNAAGFYRRKLQTANEESHFLAGHVIVFAEGIGHARLGLCLVTNSGNRAVYENARLDRGVTATLAWAVVFLATTTAATAGSNCQ